VIRDEGAFPGLRVAGRGEADRVGAFVRVSAEDNRIGEDCAGVGKLALVAVQGAVADVPVLEALAIFVGHAVTLYLEAGALALLAAIPDGARIPVIALQGVVLHGAAAQAVAHVVGARVVIVTSYGQSHAFTRIAVVSYRARISVDAFPLGLGDVLAPLFPFAGIFGAIVAVIADVLVFSFNQSRFVHLPVTVVIFPVAGFSCRNRGIAFRQAGFRAYAHALADACLVDVLARSPQSKGDGSVGAGAPARVVDTLFELNTIHRNDVRA